MSRHLLLLPAPEAQWADLPPEEHAKGYRSHQQFHRDLEAGGHDLLAVSPLRPSAEATSLRPDGEGGVLVSDGPFTESVEQVVGYYLVQTHDRADLLRVCREFAARGELIEFRDLDEPDDDRPAEDGSAADDRTAATA